MGLRDIGIPFLMTLFAGLATGLGGILVLKGGSTKTRMLSVSLGFSAGVMIYVSFMELMPQALSSILSHFGDGREYIAILAFFSGILLIGLIDALIPEAENPHEYTSDAQMEEVLRVEKEADAKGTKVSKKNDELHRVGLFSALAIAIHNFPEGIATFMSAMVDPALGISIAVAVAIHNIPEGISVAVPIYYATGSKKRAVLYALLSGLAEPLGALAGALLLLPFLNGGLMGVIFAMVAGIMVYISLDELLPAAEKYGQHHMVIYGTIAGMALMAVSLLIL